MLDPWNPPDTVTEAAARLSRHDAGEALEQIYGGEATPVDTVANAWYWRSDPKAVAAYEADKRAVTDWVKAIVKQREERQKEGAAYREGLQNLNMAEAAKAYRSAVRRGIINPS